MSQFKKVTVLAGIWGAMGKRELGMDGTLRALRPLKIQMDNAFASFNCNV
jgi:hypothetical protein